MPPICPMTVGMAVEMTAVSRLTRKVATNRAIVTRRRAGTHMTLAGWRAGVRRGPIVRPLGGARPDATHVAWCPGARVGARSWFRRSGRGPRYGQRVLLA